METIHLHLLDIRSARGREADISSLLPASRVEKAGRFIRTDDRLRSLCAGYLLTRYVGDYTVDGNGKPRSGNCFFSLSHAGRFAGIAVGYSGELGLDFEPAETDKNTEKLSDYCLNDAERLVFPPDAFLKAFVAKESLAKADGRGLRPPVRSIPALPLDGAVNYETKTYYRHSFERNGYLFSIAREGNDFAVETDEIEVDLCCSNDC